MARAGRASKIGTRAGRVVRVIRLVRLMKLVKKKTDIDKKKSSATKEYRGGEDKETGYKKKEGKGENEKKNEEKRAINGDVNPNLIKGGLGVKASSSILWKQTPKLNQSFQERQGIVKRGSSFSNSSMLLSDFLAYFNFLILNHSYWQLEKGFRPGDERNKIEWYLGKITRGQPANKSKKILKSSNFFIIDRNSQVFSQKKKPIGVATSHRRR